MTLSSKLPPMPATVMVASLPTTCAATISTDSGITGLTLPGMIELPGCRLGMAISPMPQRGPEASQRMSLAILLSETAMVLRAPEVSTAASLAAIASKRLAAGTKGKPVRSASRAITRGANSGGALRPVPTAVPPSGTSANRGSAAARRARPSRACRA